MVRRPTTPEDRWEARGAGLYAGPEQQLDPDELRAYAAALLAEVDDYGGARAAWHLRDLVLNAGDAPTGSTAGGAEAVLDALRALRRKVGGPSVHGKARPHMPPDRTWMLYRGGPDPIGCSWTDDARIARTYARSRSDGFERHPEAPVWTLDVPTTAVLAVVPVAAAGGPDEYVLDPAEVDLEQATRVSRDDLPRPLRRRGGRIDWTCL